MYRYIIRRLLFLIPIMFIISLISFFLIYLSPGDPAQIFLSQGGSAPSKEAVDALREELGLNRPLYIQYFSWIGNALTGNLGTSISNGKPVMSELLRTLPNTLKLTALSMLWTLIISLPLGIWSAVKENRFTDYLIRICTFISSSLPGFFAALLLIYIFAVKLRWLPTISTGSDKGIILPAMTLALTLSAGYIRQIRTAIIKELQEDYIRMARARGITESCILLRGVLKSILPSVLTIAGINIGQLLGGTAIIEMVCSYSGVGRLAVEAVSKRDYPMVQGYVLFMALAYVIVNLIVDILHALADPRVKKQMLSEL